jgi:hypothetical protein
MPFSSQNSKDYITIINNMVKPGYNSKYSGQLNNVIDRILNREDFTYDVGKDPLYSQYKQQYVELGKEAAANAVSAVSNLTAGYGNSYAASAASQSNQQYLTQLNERIPQLMNAAMQKYQLEQENLYKQFGALQNEESRLYGQYRDTTEDYYRDVAGLENDYARALAQENTLAERAYRAERDKRADYEWNETFNRTKDRDTRADYEWNESFNRTKDRDNQADYRWNQNLERTKSNDAISDQQWQDKFNYKKERDLVSDEQWQKEFDLKQLQEAMKAAKSSSGGSGRRSGGSISASDAADSFFKMQGTAAVKNYSGNKVDTSRNATLSVTKTREFLNEMLQAGSDSEVQQILNAWAESGYISQGDYNYLVDYYEKLKERGISQLRAWKSPKVTTTTNAGTKQSTAKSSTKNTTDEKSSNVFKRAIEKVKQLTK